MCIWLVKIWEDINSNSLFWAFLHVIAVLLFIVLQATHNLVAYTMDMGLGEIRSWQWTGGLGVLRFIGSQRVGDWVTELNGKQHSFVLLMNLQFWYLVEISHLYPTWVWNYLIVDGGTTTRMAQAHMTDKLVLAIGSSPHGSLSGATWTFLIWWLDSRASCPRDRKVVLKTRTYILLVKQQ